MIIKCRILFKICVFNIQYIYSYFCDLDTYYTALDGCSTRPTDPNSPYNPASQNFLASTSSAEVQCCSIDGQSCYRHNPATSQCWSGDDTAAKATWHEANEMCTSAGYRLCKSQEELDLCCSTGCHYNNQLIWTSLEAGTKLQALH